MTKLRISFGNIKYFELFKVGLTLVLSAVLFILAKYLMDILSVTYNLLIAEIIFFAFLPIRAYFRFYKKETEKILPQIIDFSWLLSGIYLAEVSVLQLIQNLKIIL